MPLLVPPSAALYEAWTEAHDEWGPGLHEDGFGLRPTDDTSSPAAFAAWVSRLDADPVRLWWIVEGDAVVGGIGLRPDDDPLTEGHGHIGYGIRPSFRQRGIATWALGEVLREAGAGGFQRVLIVCERDNVASARVAERHGGTLDQAGGGGEVLRYWVPATS